MTKFAKSLTYDEAMIILALNPGDTELVHSIISNMEPVEGDQSMRFAESIAVSNNLHAKSLDTAYSIITEIKDKFDMLPSREMISNWHSPDLCSFIQQHYHAEYPELGVPLILAGLQEGGEF